VRTLVKGHQFVSFFNDVTVNADDPRIPAVEYFATKGFFPDYNARLDEPLKAATARVWAVGFTQLQSGTGNPDTRAHEVAESEAGQDVNSSLREFLALLPNDLGAIAKEIGLSDGTPLKRGDACRLLFASLERRLK
jgi:hypothetical protein